jgi:serine/threonine protein kinase
MTNGNRRRIGTTEPESSGSGRDASGIVLASTPPAMPSFDDREPQDESQPPITGEAQPRLSSGLGSGLLAQQPTPSAENAVAVAKVCPQCGTEYETGDRFCPKDGSPLRPMAGGDPLIGRVIAERYLVLARIGEGGMGRVYLAEHVKMNRQCAIKVMNPSLINDTESLQRFAREASSAARILHPNVAAVFDYGEADKIVYLVMEFVDGESLSAILARDGALEPRRAIELARQIADGLNAAHELNIVHRDLKPDNVIVARTKAGKEIPKVVDFGIAKAMVEAPQDALTRSGLVIGTPEYMSPEQLLGDPVDARADIYSLGCIIYQMLTGAPAFDADSREQMIRRRLHEPPPHVRDVLPELPRRLDTLITHMLARSPKDRLASAAEARDSLDPALALGGWDPNSISGRGPISPQILGDPSLQPTIPMPKVRTSPVRVAVGTLVGSVLLLGGMWVWANTGVPSTPVASAASTAPKPVSHDSAGSVSPPVAAPNLPQLSKNDTATKAKPKAAECDAPLSRVVRAIESGNLDQVNAAVPGGLSPQQRQSFEQVFQKASRIGTPSCTFTPGTVTSASKSGILNIVVRYSDRSMTPVTAPFHFKADLALKDGKWTLSRLSAP